MFEVTFYLDLKYFSSYDRKHWCLIENAAFRKLAVTNQAEELIVSAENSLRKTLLPAK